MQFNAKFRKIVIEGQVVEYVEYCVYDLQGEYLGMGRCSLTEYMEVVQSYLNMEVE